MPTPKTPISKTLPPLIMGTATFNHQYNKDPYSLPTNALIQDALDNGIRAFDTSPYYGPSEELLGKALSTEYIQKHHPRSTYHLLTKVGRIGGSSFDYSPKWIRKSVKRSLERLNTSYLDVVYCHDVEFVSEDEVIEAVKELRRIRDSSSSSDDSSSSPVVKYIGISGYPVEVLVRIAEKILHETGEPIDLVMSYANYTLQNTRLLSVGLDRFLAAGVDVVLNASLLGMGLLRRSGVPIGGMGDFHPAPGGLRDAVQQASDWIVNQNQSQQQQQQQREEELLKIEVVAIRFALESWLRNGAVAGAMGPFPTSLSLPSSSAVPSIPSSNATTNQEKTTNNNNNRRLGISVMGVSNFNELHETLNIWRNVVNGLQNDEQQQQQHSHNLILAQGVRSVLGPTWFDYAWLSPPPDFVNSLPPDHIAFKESLD